MKNLSTPTHDQLPLVRKSINPRFTRCAALAVLLTLLGAQFWATAQPVTDNFDDGNISDWSEFTFGGTSVTFPTVGTGKGLGMQVAAGAPVPILIRYRTNIYSDFYMSTDVVSWDLNTDGEPILLGRGHDFDTAPSGYVLVYDPNTDGTGPNDRAGGSLEMYVLIGLSATPIAGASVTLEQGRAYRIVFTGVADLLTGQIYDSEDLTAPLVTIQVSEATFASGACGLVAYDDGSAGADVTFDNYHSEAYNPLTLPVSAPAIVAGLPGTPQLVSRLPAARFTNFYPPASGISFTTTNVGGDINVAATKLFLNGVNAEPLTISGPAGGPTYIYGGALVANTVYSGRIELENVAGTIKSTNTFWFDTFTDAFVSTEPVKTVEVEDYNYTNGLYLLDPIPVSGFDTNGQQVNGFTNEVQIGYLDLPGFDGVDFDDARTTPDGGFVHYRANDFVQTVQGSIEIQDILHAGPPSYYDDSTGSRGNDTTRQKYAELGMREYQVVRTEPGEWLNYTRAFANTNYHVYLRVGGYSSTLVNLDLVTGDPTQPGQTTSPLGVFSIPNQFMRPNFHYVPLMSNGVPAVVNLAGTNTIRLTIAGTPIKDNRVVNLNYLLFVPVPPAVAGPVTVFDNFNDGNDTANPAWDRYDPVFNALGAPFPPAVFSFPGGGYRILSPAPPVGDAGPARAGTFLHNAEFTDFYVAADIVDFDDTVRQAFGLAARINTPGLQTTGGYLFSWEPGSGTLPGTSNGDLDISRLVNEAPIGQIEVPPSGLHLEKGKSYRFAFMGKGNEFVAEVYELPDTSNPLIRLLATDPDNLYPSGLVGLIVADQGSGDLNNGDATFDNFLATTAEPRLTVEAAGANVTVSWPDIPFRLLSSPSLSSPVWTEVTTGITDTGDQKVHTATATDTKYYRLVYP